MYIQFRPAQNFPCAGRCVTSLLRKSGSVRQKRNRFFILKRYIFCICS